MEACFFSQAFEQLFTAEVAEVAEDSMNRNLNAVSGDVIGCAMEVHSTLGPGLLESAYEACVSYELRERGYTVTAQQPLPLVYKEVRLDVGYRIDLLVDNAVVVELKTVDKLLPIHEAQLLSDLKLSNHKLGLLINFHIPRLKDGIVRLANNL